MPRSVTQLLKAWGEGDEVAKEKLIPLVYGELHRLARHYMAGERPGDTLQTTALIHEAFLRLAASRNINWQDRAHFFAVSARIMRRILVDFARSRRCEKHGRDIRLLSLDETANVSKERGRDLIALDDALESLAEFDPRQSQIVELRFFGGLTEDETAEVLRISPRTVRREWSIARSWLYRALHREEFIPNER